MQKGRVPNIGCTTPLITGRSTRPLNLPRNRWLPDGDECFGLPQVGTEAANGKRTDWSPPPGHDP